MQTVKYRNSVKINGTKNSAVKCYLLQKVFVLFKQDWKAFQPPRRREMWQDRPKLSMTTQKSLMTILAIPIENSDNH